MLSFIFYNKYVLIWFVQGIVIIHKTKSKGEGLIFELTIMSYLKMIGTYIWDLLWVQKFILLSKEHPKNRACY